ncbi:hypothetical protein BYT27DRAFT_7212383 [Phlegmacium glaucopus]|nr:hypothetical protein BYT27DRAFT_7212383 [Phlegmacium glaucopus]
MEGDDYMRTEVGHILEASYPQSRFITVAEDDSPPSFYLNWLFQASSDSDAITIDRQLDDFMLSSRKHWILLETPSANESHQIQHSNFFQNSHHIPISGGNFSAISNNPVVHDPVLREQSVTMNLLKILDVEMKAIITQGPQWLAQFPTSIFIGKFGCVPV